MNHEGAIVAERFELEQLAGRGGMGAVYRARDRATGSYAAVKLLRDGTASEHRERFAREARLMSELTHPAFVRCLGFGCDGDTPFLAMEWLEGEDLAERLQREGLVLPRSRPGECRDHRARACVACCGGVTGPDRPVGTVRKAHRVEQWCERAATSSYQYVA